MLKTNAGGSVAFSYRKVILDYLNAELREKNYGIDASCNAPLGI